MHRYSSLSSHKPLYYGKVKFGMALKVTYVRFVSSNPYRSFSWFFAIGIRLYFDIVTIFFTVRILALDLSITVLLFSRSVFKFFCNAVNPNSI